MTYFLAGQACFQAIPRCAETSAGAASGWLGLRISMTRPSSNGSRADENVALDPLF